MNYVFDSYAMLAFFRREKGYVEVTDLLTQISAGKSLGYMCAINVGEVYYITYRKQNRKNADTAIHALLHFPIEIVEADLELTLAAAEIKANHSLSFADAFAATLTKRKKATLITGDKAFKALEKEIKVKFI